MKNKELLVNAQKEQKGAQDRVEAIEQLKISSDLPKGYVQFLDEKKKDIPKIERNQKRRPESREKKAYKKVLKDFKEVPKGMRHQNQKMLRRVKRTKKNLVKGMAESEKLR